MPVKPADAVPGDGRVNILAVDDNAGKLVALTAILADLNQNVLTASSGREALRLLLQREFAVVLLDVHMPGMDGFEAAALIRQRESSEHTPIIFGPRTPYERTRPGLPIAPANILARWIPTS